MRGVFWNHCICLKFDAWRSEVRQALFSRADHATTFLQPFPQAFPSAKETNLIWVKKKKGEILRFYSN